MDGFEVDADVLVSAARALRAGSGDLEGSHDAAQAPDVGASSGLVAAVLARLAESTAGIVEGLDALANETDAAARDYEAADESAGQQIDAAACRVGR